MYTLISYPAGVIREGIIVKSDRNRMRVLAAGLRDALDLRRAGAHWLTNEGKPVEFRFVELNSASSRWVC